MVRLFLAAIGFEFTEREKLPQTNKILGFFASFQINQIQNSAIQIHRMKD